MNKFITCLWFDKGEARKAAEFYASVFPDTHVGPAHGAATDFPGGQEGDAGRDRLDDSDWVDPRARAVERRHVDDLQRQHAEHRRRDANQGVGTQAGRPIAPFPLEADRRPESHRQRHSCQGPEI